MLNNVFSVTHEGTKATLARDYIKEFYITDYTPVFVDHFQSQINIRLCVFVSRIFNNKPAPQIERASVCLRRSANKPDFDCFPLHLDSMSFQADRVCVSDRQRAALVIYGDLTLAD